ncbi:PhzF family phenazine biosynthesis protein [Sphaerotilus sulfidivorans]|nr:hypothetical protein QMTAC487_17940 [Sphaerotilus sp. FB-3]
MNAAALPRRYAVLDVFTATPLLGNPLAVVIDAEGLSDAQMAACARWTNLSETTFLLPPTDPAADYRVRIFTPGGELPFAGHPTLGSAQAWLDAGGVPQRAGEVVQECGVGRVRVRRVDVNGAGAAMRPPSPRCWPRCGWLRLRCCRWNGSTTAPAGSACGWRMRRRCARCSPTSRRWRRPG